MMRTHHTSPTHIMHTSPPHTLCIQISDTHHAYKSPTQIKQTSPSHTLPEGTGCFRSLRIDFTETDHCSGYSSDRNVSISRDQSNKHAAPVGGGQRNTDQNGGFPDSCSLHESILSDEYLVPVEENVVKKIPVFDEEPHHRMTQYCDTNAMFSQNPLAEEHKTNAPPAGPPRPPMMN